MVLDQTESEKGHLLPKKEELPKDEGGYFRGDGMNFALLFTLYTLQGIALGMTNALPIILQNKHITFSNQATFTFSTWPFSLKLLWAPILDVVYSARFGKRKSWLVPSQILLGFLLLFVSVNFDHWIGDEAGEDGSRTPNIPILTAAFFFINFLTATQDIALDGWAVTMLQRRNVGFVGTCSFLGQMIGITIGNNIFIILDSADMCNTYLFWLRPEPQPYGILSFPPFMCFWAIVFLVTTIIVAIFKKETNLDEDKLEKSLELSLLSSYKLAIDILRLKPVMYLSVLLILGHVAFVPNETVSMLKMIDSGLSQDKIAAMGIATIPFLIFLPVILRKFILKPRHLGIYVTVIPYRLLEGILGAAIVSITSQYDHGNFNWQYYCLVMLNNGFDQFISGCQSISNLAFVASVCDPRCGATYMALMATLSNLGQTWPSTTALSLVDALTWKKCVTGCASNLEEPCVKIETCSTYVDGFYVETAACTLFGLVWWWIAKQIVDYLHGTENSMWLVHNSDIDHSDEKPRQADCTEISGDVFVERKSSSADPANKIRTLCDVH